LSAFAGVGVIVEGLKPLIGIVVPGPKSEVKSVFISNEPSLRSDIRADDEKPFMLSIDMPAIDIGPISPAPLMPRLRPTFPSDAFALPSASSSRHSQCRSLVSHF